jgi:hypothetical protein
MSNQQIPTDGSRAKAQTLKAKRGGKIKKGGGFWDVLG